MLFNSFEFIFIFLPSVFFIYFILIKLGFFKISTLFLTIASLAFYSYYNISYLTIILASIIFNYTISKMINKKILFIGIIANLSLLGYFKYTDFFITNLNAITGSNIDLMHIVLPLAISFFTFQQIAFLVDSYHGNTKEYNFTNYALFISFFPQLIAGPIVHHKEMMPQFSEKNNQKINYENISKGIFIFIIGLCKKMVIADYLASFATAGFNNTHSLNFIDAWTSSLSYTFQLYFDFSGYCDMAVGAALLFNIKLPINFNSPYKALNVQDFWRRWHITLSRFLRDYIYIPLGGNKKTQISTYCNLFAVFLIGGLWHGAGWGFIVWGALHGVAQVIYRITSHFKRPPKIIAWIITFLFINFTWVFFRADNLADAINVIKAMLGFNGFDIKPIIGSQMALIAITMSLIVCTGLKNSNQMMQNAKFGWASAIFTALLIVSAYFASLSTEVSPFLYFNF